MFCPAPPVAPFEWQPEQERSLKIGPAPSCTVSVSEKFALAAENCDELVPGRASPSAKSRDTSTCDSSSAAEPHAASVALPATASTAAIDARVNFLFR